MTLITKLQLAILSLSIALPIQFISAQPTSPELLARYSPDNSAAAHEIWHVSTRGLSQYGRLERDVDKIEYLQLVSGQWQRRTADDSSVSQDIDTCFLIHGSLVSTELVLQVSLDVYQPIPPVVAVANKSRYVIWSWPEIGRVHA